MNRMNGLGYLRNLKHLYSIHFINIQQLEVTNFNLLKNTSIKEIDATYINSGTVNRLQGDWRVLRNSDILTLNTCDAGLLHYNDKEYSPVDQKVNWSSVVINDDVIYNDNYEECVAKFCRNPGRIFECNNMDEFYE